MNLFPESMNLFPETFYTYGQIPSGLGGAIIRQPNLGAAPADALGAIYRKVFGEPDWDNRPEETAANYALVSNAIYGIIGAGLDERDWNKILNSSDPLQAAIDEFVTMVSKPDYQRRNFEYLLSTGRYSPQEILNTYLQWQREYGIPVDTAYFMQDTYAQAYARAQEASQAEAARLESIRLREIEDARREEERILRAVEEAQQRQLQYEQSREAARQATEQYYLTPEYAAEMARVQAEQAPIIAAEIARIEAFQEEMRKQLTWFEADQFANASAETKAAYYNKYLDQGKTNEEIRFAAEIFFGMQNENDWTALQQLAQMQREQAQAEAAAQAAAAQAQAQAAAQAAADQQAAIDVFNRLRQQQTEADQQAEAEAAALRELEKAQTAAARNFPWFEAEMFANATAEQKAAAYLRYIDMGKNDSEIRSAAQAFFGFQKEADWQLLQEMARQIAIDRAGPIRVTEPPMREEVITQLAKQPAGNAGAIALAALAAALLLGA